MQIKNKELGKRKGKESGFRHFFFEYFLFEHFLFGHFFFGHFLFGYFFKSLSENFLQQKKLFMLIRLELIKI
jgi:hypothetical protein